MLIDWLIKLSVEMLQPLIWIQRRGNFVYVTGEVNQFIGHWLITLDPWLKQGTESYQESFCLGIFWLFIWLSLNQSCHGQHVGILAILPNIHIDILINISANLVNLYLSIFMSIVLLWCLSYAKTVQCTE